jgi:MFS family permease
MSGGLIGVVVPLYLAECLPAQNRGKGTGIFQWLLTLGIGAAALVGIYFSYHVEEVALLGGPAALFVFKKHSWRMSRPPGILITLGACFVSESPRWLYTRVATDWKEAADGSHNTSFNAQTTLTGSRAVAHPAETLPGSASFQVIYTCNDYTATTDFPAVARIGYSSMFYLFAFFTVGYLLTSAFLMPETKGDIERG